MKFKIDENLPQEAADILRAAGFDADTVWDESLSGADDQNIADRLRSESRALLTLDLDFANIRAYPPEEYPGIILLRLKAQDKATVLEYVRNVAALLKQRTRRASCGFSNVIECASGDPDDLDARLVFPTKSPYPPRPPQTSKSKVAHKPIYY